MSSQILTPQISLSPHNSKLNGTTTTTSKSSNYRPGDHPLLSLLDDPTALTTTTLKQIHGRMLRLDLLSHPYSASKLISALSLPPNPNNPNLPYSLRLFHHLPDPNLFTYNTLIRASDPATSLLLFSRLLHLSPHAPDNFTFPFALKAASLLPSLPLGSAIHAMVLKSPPSLSSHPFVLNSLLHFYASCGCLHLSLQLFSRFPDKDAVSFNSMIAAFNAANRPEDALRLFRQMIHDSASSVRPNDVTMVSVLSACGMEGDLELGRWAHRYIQQNEITSSLILDNALLDMYVKCGGLRDAERLFDEMPSRDSISWTTMIVGYAKAGEFAAARKLFDEIPSRDVACWNALISGYEQNGKPKDALAMFSELLRVADVQPDEVTLVAGLSACSQLGAAETGFWIHDFIKKHNFKLNFHLTTSLIDMYSNCGELEKALDVFNSSPQRDVFVWSAMIAGHAMYGRGTDALDLFTRMQEAGIAPNRVTFTNLFCACSHAGLVEAGRLYFARMLPDYGVEPDVEHYGCMVDILGRAGLLNEARALIDSMPVAPTASTWGALLGACVVHKNTDLGEYAYKRLTELEPANDGAYVLLSNLYAKSGNWNRVAVLRSVMKNAGIKKERGCSSIEVDGILHEFLVGDVSHPQSEKIYMKLDEVVTRLRAVGYVPDKTQLLQDVEDEDVKEKALYLHSEKLAIVFGLISTAAPKPIRVAKNLRVCEDCHAVAEMVSRVYEREIVLRDRYRFHHFKDGKCSCMGYW